MVPISGCSQDSPDPGWLLSAALSGADGLFSGEGKLHLEAAFTGELPGGREMGGRKKSLLLFWPWAEQGEAGLTWACWVCSRQQVGQG